MKRLLLLILLNFYLLSPAISAQSTLKFTRLGVEDGLPDRTIWELQQDNRGLIWLGTSNGLVAYNGYEFKQYRNPVTDSKNFDANVIRAINIDSNNEILVGTYAGLARTKANSSSLKSIDIQISEKVNLSDLSVFAILKTQNKEVWLGTDKGLYIFDGDLTSSKYTPSNNNKYKNTPSNRVNSIIETRNGLIYIATNNGLFYLDKSAEFRQVFLLEANQENLIVQKLLEKGNGEIIVGTNDGVFQVISDTDNLPRLKRIIPTLRNKFVYSLAEVGHNEIWIGTRNFGLFTYNRQGQLDNNKYNSDDPNGLSDNDVYSLLVDRTGVVWAGSFNAGVNRIDPRTRNFQLFNDQENSLNCLESPVIYSIFEQTPNIIWLGTQMGLARVTLSPFTCNLYTTDKANSIWLSGRDVLSIKQDHVNKDLIHIGTRFAIDTIDSSNLIRVFDSTLQHIKSMLDYVKTPNNTEYIASSRSLYLRQEYEHSYEKIESLDQQLEQTNYIKLANSGNKLYVASWKGLLTVNSDHHLERINWKNASHLNNPIRSLLVDSKKRIWIGIDNIGLFCHNETGQLLFKFTDRNYLTAINGFSSILESKNGDIWISSTSGISHLDLEDNEIYNYHSSDGLAGEAYVNGAFFQSSSDIIYFGNRNGLTRFQPEQIQRNSQTPQLLISKFIYFNEIYETASPDKNFSLETAISELDKLELTHEDYVFGFEFIALHYSDPKRNEFAYMMENWDSDWNYTDANFRRANYSNLPPGNYTFKVKASNHHGAWNPVPIELPVVITPPWWRTYWAYLAYFLILVALVYGFVTFRTYSLKRKADELQSSVTERTAELAFEKEKVEQLLSQKNEEFANVSHEFRTPLTLILGPAAQLLRSQKSGDDKQKLNTIQRNGYRLLRMVEQLLNLETFRVKSITQKSPQPISETIQLLAEAFSDLAEEKKIDFNIQPIDKISFEFTPDAIEKIILNLLSNAVKYTPGGGRISVDAKRTPNDHYQIVIKDTGIGIPSDKLDTIFERFNRVLDERSEKVTGAGIGLALVKSLVESHGGEISITSELNQGTTMTVTLPIINEVHGVITTDSSNEEVVAMEIMSLKEQPIIESSNDLNHEDTNSSEKPSLLLIEDNLDMQNYIRSSISDTFKVSTANNGEQGLQVAKEEVPDLIISDIMMPRMDGYETTRRLRQDEVTSHIPVVLLTARGDRESRLKGWHEKADEYLTKPFDVEELKIRLTNLMAIRNILRKRFGESLFQETSVNEEVPASDLEQNKNKLQQVFVSRLNQVIEELYAEPNTSIDEIAKSAAISKRQLFRKLKSILDMTPAEYLRRFRLEKAKQLLKDGHNAGYVAAEAGFSSQSYFGKCFKAQFGCSPAKFAKNKAH